MSHTHQGSFLTSAAAASLLQHANLRSRASMVVSVWLYKHYKGSCSHSSLRPNRTEGWLQASSAASRHLKARQLKHALERLHVGERLSDGVRVAAIAA